MTYQHITVEPVADAPVGAAITGADLSAPLDAGVVAEIRAAWLSHQVVFFPNQSLDHESLERFTNAIGPFGHDPYIKPLDDYPHILEIRREPDEKASAFGASWHSDWSFQDEPPAATLLHSKIVPPVGGDTLFADGYGAYEALDEATKARLDGLNAVHSAAMPYSNEGFYANEEEPRAMTILPGDSARATHCHPLVRTHPETGRKALFVNSVYTVGIDGMDENEAAELLGLLFLHSIKPRFVYRHKWRPDMLLMWDNRCLQHCAEGGYDGHRRVMHRTTVAGDTPVA